MFVPVRVISYLLVATLAGSPGVRGEDLAGSRETAVISQIDQITESLPDRLGEGRYAWPDSASIADLGGEVYCGTSVGPCEEAGEDPRPLAGGANEAVVSQGTRGSPCTLCVVDLLQVGIANGVRIEQDGDSNTIFALQNGYSNEFLGLQSGANNFIGVNQHRADNFADISQYGDGHSIAVTQPGNGFIVITQE